jgi:hypothetical protein
MQKQLQIRAIFTLDIKGIAIIQRKTFAKKSK